MSIGNIIPESIITGNMKATAETISAVSCVLTMVETRSPIERDSITYSNETQITFNKLLEKGIPKTVYEMASMIPRMIQERRKYGTSFPKMIVLGFMGETNNRLIVPFSFSPTIDTDVIMAQIRIKIIPRIPGTKL